MIKIMFGAGVIIALVGWGVITPNDVQDWGDTVRSTVNLGLERAADATDDPDLVDKITELDYE